MSSRGGVPLPVGTRLLDYEITDLVAEGGFGIVYAAFDHALERRVAVKEYMPGSLATRTTDLRVVVRAPEHDATFRAGLRSFLNEAQLLASFDHPALIKVLAFWEEHGTAYMAMPLYEGRTLKEVLVEHPKLDEAWLRALLVPMLDALETLHGANCYHRDVSPDNILILDSGVPILLDFGAARRIIANLTKDVTVILKPGYAPIEQYGSEQTMGRGQGPWTDIYAVAAVLHRAVTGKPPPTPVTRLVTDPLRPLRETTTGYSDAFLAGIDHGLAVRPEQRPQTVAAFREALGLKVGAQRVPSSVNAAPAASGETIMATEPNNDDPDATRLLARELAARAVSVTGHSHDTGGGTKAVASPVSRIPVSSSTLEAEAPRSRSWVWPIVAVIVAIAGVVEGAYLILALSGSGSPPAVPAPRVQMSASSAPATQQDQAYGAPAASPAGVASTAAHPGMASVAPLPSSPSLPPVGAVSTSALTAPASVSPATGQSEAPRSPSLASSATPETQGAAAAEAVRVGKLKLAIRPWGEVVVDGRSRGLSPPIKELELPAGRHTIVVRNGSFPEYARDVNVDVGATTTIDHAFK